MTENNRVTLKGEIVEEFKFSHSVRGEKFYETKISTERLSGAKDILPILVSDRLVAVDDEWTGQCTRVSGSFRSHNKSYGERTRLILQVFAEEIEVIEDGGYSLNEIELEGYICRETTYRETPQGREISDALIAVNRRYGKSDYIPCIAWGRNARFVDGLSVGDHVRLEGRIQSREYTKKIGEDEYEERVAYEVSISSIELVEEVGGDETDN